MMLHAIEEREIAETCMLISLRVSQWTGRKKDRDVSETATNAYNAERDAGTFHKALLPDLVNIQKVVNAARTTYYHLTVPWQDNGDRIVSVALYDKLVGALRKHREAFDVEVIKIASDYTRRVSDQQARLGNMFRASDYPTADGFRARFEFRWFVSPLPVSDDIRFRVGDGERDRIRAETRKALEEGINASVREVWTRLHEAVKHAYEKLSDGSAIFRDTLIGNIEELVDVLPGLNLTNDPALTQAGEEVRRALVGLDPNRLRKNKHARKTAAEAARAALVRIERAGSTEAPSEEVSEKLQEVNAAANKFDF